MKLYKLREVEQILKLSRRTLLRYISSGKLKAVKVGNGWRVSEQDLRELLEGN